MLVDTTLARAKLYAAIVEQSETTQQPFALRPSNIGQCPLRLQYTMQDAQQGVWAEARNPRHIWSMFQGKVLEELMTLLLQAAGAEVVVPPHDSDQWDEQVPPDPDTGFRPHLDALIRWPTVGLNDWAVLEVKDLRVMAHLDLLFNRLYYDRTYWLQCVSYLRTAPLAIANYARAEMEAGIEGPWAELHSQGVVPSGIFFVSSAKDPATANMMAQQKITVPGYETKVPKKGWTEQQLAMMALRKVWRERWDENEGDPAFYFEYIERADASVSEAWDDIINIRRKVEQTDRAEPLYDVMVPDDQLETECRWYCPYLERHRNAGLTLLEQLEQSVELTQTAQTMKSSEEDPFA